MIMERKVGEIFEYNGEWYQCVEQPKQYDCATVCELCSFNVIGNCDLDKCSGTYRSDSKSVIFKKLKKVGEPEIINGKKVQSIVTGYVGCAFCIFKKGGACLSGGTCKNRGTRIYVEIKQNKEDMEEKKLNLKPFDLEAAKAGKPVCTRDGRKARIICFDAKCNKPIVALIYDCNKETVFQYLESGRFFVDQIDKYDLMMFTQKKEGWLNIYKDFEDTVCCVYPTEKEALEDGETEKDYITTIKIEWEE